jgi:hypothetical protein
MATLPFQLKVHFTKVVSRTALAGKKSQAVETTMVSQAPRKYTTAVIIAVITIQSN